MVTAYINENLRQPACAQVVRKLGVVHLCVSSLAQLGVVRPELLVALVQQIDLEKVIISAESILHSKGKMYLRIVQPWIDILVDVPVLGPQLGAVVRPPLARELAVEDQDVPLILLFAAVISVQEHHVRE